MEHCSAVRYCRGAYECYDETLNTDAVCYGDHSCAFAEFNSDWISCGGAFSCFGSPLMEINSTYLGVHCDALYSCAMINLITNQGSIVSDSSSISANLDCTGEQSCLGTTVSLTDNTDLDLNCYGDHGCANMNIEINGTSETTVYGSLGAANAIFNIYADSDSFNSHSFDFWGGASGYNTTINCGGYSLCNINCYGDACSNLSLICGDNAQCVVDCSRAELSSVCDDSSVSYSIDALPGDWGGSVPSLKDKTFSTFANSRMYCNDTDGDGFGYNNRVYVYGDGNDIDDVSNSSAVYGIIDELESGFINGSMCCTGYTFCGDFNMTVDGNESGIAARCDGLSSCAVDSFKPANEIFCPNGGDLYFSGMLKSIQIP